MRVDSGGPYAHVQVRLKAGFKALLELLCRGLKGTLELSAGPKSGAEQIETNFRLVIEIALTCAADYGQV